MRPASNFVPSAESTQPSPATNVTTDGATVEINGATDPLGTNDSTPTSVHDAGAPNDHIDAETYQLLDNLLASVECKPVTDVNSSEYQEEIDKMFEAWSASKPDSSCPPKNPQAFSAPIQPSPTTSHDVSPDDQTSFAAANDPQPDFFSSLPATDSPGPSRRGKTNKKSFAASSVSAATAYPYASCSKPPQSSQRYHDIPIPARIVDLSTQCLKAEAYELLTQYNVKAHKIESERWMDLFKFQASPENMSSVNQNYDYYHHGLLDQIEEQLRVKDAQYNQQFPNNLDATAHASFVNNMSEASNTPALPIAPRQIADASADTDTKQLQPSKSKIGPRATRILNKWLERHSKHPYPSAQVCQIISDETGMTVSQVRRWYQNRRQQSGTTKSYADITQQRRLKARQGREVQERDEARLRQDIIDIDHQFYSGQNEQ